MSRVFEVVETTNHSKLTISPTRVTLKVIPEDNRDELIEAAKNISDNISYEKTLRGTFFTQDDDKKIRLSDRYKGTTFTYNYKGELL